MFDIASARGRAHGRSAAARAASGTTSRRAGCAAARAEELLEHISEVPHAFEVFDRHTGPGLPGVAALTATPAAAASSASLLSTAEGFERIALRSRRAARAD